MSWNHYLNFANGMHYNSSDFLKTDFELKMLNGCNSTQKLGALTKDLGYSQIGNLSSGKNITGLYNFRQAAGTQKMLITTNNSGGTATELYYSTGGNMTEITDAETAWNTYEDAAVEMETMDGYCYFVGYDSTDSVFLPVASLTGTTFSTSTNVTSMPTAKYIKRYRDRIYIGNCYSGAAYPYRVYFSTVPSSGSITWTTATNFLDVDYGEYITGLGENWDRLLVFTTYSCYGYNQSQWKKLWDTGCSNQRTIRNFGPYTLFANNDGVWMTSGGKPDNISRKVQSFIRAATMTNAFAEIVDEEYHIYLGNITVDGVSYTNLKLIYHIPYQIWHIRECYDTLTIFARYNSSGNVYLWHGDSQGEIMQWSKYSDSNPVYTDDTYDINSHFQLNKIHLGMPQIEKKINQIITYTEYAQGLKLSARVVDRNSSVLMDWQPLTECKKMITEARPKFLAGNFLEIQGREKSGVRSWVMDGFSLEFVANTSK